MARTIGDRVLKEMTEHHPRPLLKLMFPRETFRAIHDRRILKAMTRKVLKAASLAEAHKLLAEGKTKPNGRRAFVVAPSGAGGAEKHVPEGTTTNARS